MNKELFLGNGRRWARSDNAFLNSPPEKEIMGKHSKYFAQFEVATKANQTSETT